MISKEQAVRLYEVSDRELLQNTLNKMHEEQKESSFDESVVLDELSIRADAQAKRLTKKANSLLQSVYEKNHDLIDELDNGTRRNLSFEFYEILKKKRRSRAGFVGSLVRRGYLRPEHVDTLDGSLDIDALAQTEYFQNNTHLLKVLEGYQLTKKSKLRQRAEEMNTVINTIPVPLPSQDPPLLPVFVADQDDGFIGPSMTEQRRSRALKNTVKATVATGFSVAAIAGTIYFGDDFLGMNNASTRSCSTPRYEGATPCATLYDMVIDDPTATPTVLPENNLGNVTHLAADYGSPTVSADKSLIQNLPPTAVSSFLKK